MKKKCIPVIGNFAVSTKPVLELVLYWVVSLLRPSGILGSPSLIIIHNKAWFWHSLNLVFLFFNLFINGLEPGAMRNKMPYHSWSLAWNLKNCFLPSQLENMTNSEKPPFESKNKVGYVSFCFETRLPNYLVGLKKKQKTKNLSDAKSNFGNKLLSKNDNAPHGRVLLL